MKKLLYILLGALFLLPGLASCVKESVIEVKTSGSKLRLSVEVDGIVDRTGTRSVASVNDEDKIGSLYLLFFPKTGDRSGQYIDYIEVEIPDGMASMNVDTDIDFSGKPTLNPSNAYNILAIANIGDNYYVDGSVDSWMSQWNGETESQVMARAQSVLPSSIESDGLPMHGRMEKPAGETQAHLLLSRDVSRFDVAMDSSVRGTHDLVSVSIWNAYTATSIWEQGVMDYSDPGTRTRYHYTVRNEDNFSGEGPDPMLGDVNGGLYAFENRVASPRPNDNLTTCLIIGLKDRTGGKVTYYRVNMVGNTGAQQLKRNNAYNLTITAVDGPGANTEEIAYLGESNRLRYTIGQWALDDNGLIVQDEYSVLSIPTKTVTFGQKAQTVELSIHTYSTLPSPAPLTVRSQTYRPVSDNIQASLDNNTLIIEAKELPISETERSGVIVLSYAGLEISLNVVQSAVHDDYLNVALPDGGIPRFPAYAGISSGLVTVQATGPWTAKIYLDGFSFNPSTALAPVKVIKSTDALVVDTPDDATTKKFRIYTHSFNMGEKARSSFIVVELDKDPETYASVIRLSQANVKQINVQLPDGDGEPDGVNRTTAAATFNGAGTGLVAGITGNTDKFFVVSGRNDNNEILSWDAMLVMNGSSDDTGHFEFTETEPNSSEPDQNYVTAGARGMNISGRDYTATLRVQTDPGTFADIILTQRSASFDLIPAVLVGTIPAAGGTSEWITVDTDAGEWTLGKFAINSSIASDGRKLVKHTASLEVTDNNGVTVSDFVEGQSYPATTKFRVKYPKIYYPNRGIEIVTTVTIKVGGMEKTIIAQQAGLRPRGMIGYGMTSAPFYSGLLHNHSINGENYFQAWEGWGNQSGTGGLLSIPGWSHLGSTNDTDNAFLAVTSIDPSVTYLQVVPHIGGNDGDNYQWTAVNDYMTTRDAWTVISCQADQLNAINNDKSPMRYYPKHQHGQDRNARIDTRHSETKIYRFFFENGNTPLSADNFLGSTYFYVDATNNYLDATQLPATAVVIMTKQQNDSTSVPSNSNDAVLIFDIRNRFMWIGESQVFWDRRYLNADQYALLENMMHFTGNASKYGSSFTDMFLEETHVTAADRAAGIIPMPAPWDPYWDESATGGTDNRGVPSK